MYLTKNVKKKGEEIFDWNNYFLKDNGVNNLPIEEVKDAFLNIRRFLKEEPISMTFSLTYILRTLLEKANIPKNPTILELGAATGFLSRWFLDEYGGKGTLVDNNESSYRAYKQGDYDDIYPIKYCIANALSFESDKIFDIVCSFGLIEHFRNKKNILNAHKKFVSKDGGYLVFLVPMDSLLTKIYFEIHPELNLGYRELLTKDEFISILQEHDLSVLCVSKSSGYVYDFIGALCQC